MIRNKRFFLFVLFLLLLAPSAFAKSGHMKLLAVSQENGTQTGSIADLYLNIQPGSGKVFLDTFPLTQFDTQISTRFAKEIACDYIDYDCSRYDFFYTIDSDAPIVAGASAGTAISALTISLLKDYKMDESVAVTGTINSGGLVGPVGGVKEKIEAAKKDGIKEVLVPKGAKIFVDGNRTTPLYNFSRNISIKITEISSLADAVEHLTGKNISGREENIEINKDYENTMKYLANSLCDRTGLLKNRTSVFYDNKSLERAENLTAEGRKILETGSYYSAASYCFGANVEYMYLALLSQNLTKQDIEEKAGLIKDSIKNFDGSLDKGRIKTITDLEAYMVVKERLLEAQDYMGYVLDNSTEDNESLRDLAYGVERLNSAKSWAVFLDNRGKKFDLNDDVLKASCKMKLEEAEERYQYVNLYFPSALENTRKEMDQAYSDLSNGDYALCVFRAGKAKAGLDIILNVFYLDQDEVSDVVSEKIDAAKRNLLKETNKGIFPILAYSYYEYAITLQKDDMYSSLLYAEYALEMSNLDIYFKEKTNPVQDAINNIDTRYAAVFIIGILTGMLIMTIKPSRRKSAGKKR